MARDFGRKVRVGTAESRRVRPYGLKPILLVEAISELKPVCRQASSDPRKRIRIGHLQLREVRRGRLRSSFLTSSAGGRAS
jgi:hypothetical protein